MSHSSEDRLGDLGPESKQTSARILPFQRPPTDLQRAVQMRAQEALEIERERARTKPAPLRWAIIFVLALVPVLAVVAGLDAFVRVFHHINDTYSKMPVPAAEPQTSTEELPAAPQPGVVILQPLPDESETPPARE